MSRFDVNVPRDLIAEYREELESALAIEQGQERIYYVRHKAILDKIEPLIGNSANVESIQTLIAMEHRSFGWAYLSGDHGSRAETAFNALANSFEGGSSVQ